MFKNVREEGEYLRVYDEENTDAIVELLISKEYYLACCGIGS